MNNVIKVKDWNLLKQLVELSQEYAAENKQYDAPFAVYAVELVRRWQLKNHAFYVVLKDNIVAGYFILYTDNTGLNNSIYVYDLFVSKDFRGMKLFRVIIDYIKEFAISNNFNRAVFPTELPEKVWKRLTGLRTNTKITMQILHPEYEE